MFNQPYAIVVPNYDEKRELELPFLMGERVYGELPDRERFSLIYADETVFSDGSNKISLRDSVRGKKVYVINQGSLSPNESVITITIIVDALRRCDAEELVVFEPYLPCLRQDRAQGREPITSRMIGDIYSKVGVDRVMTFHPHVEQAVMAFGSECPLEAFPTYKYIGECYRENHHLDGSVVCAPDLGAVKNAKRFAEFLGLPLSILSKSRTGADDVQIDELIGNVEGKRVITFDDILGTGGTALKGRDYLINKGGAQEVVICATHLGLYKKRDPKTKDVFDPREEILRQGIHVIGTDTIPHEFTDEEKEYFDIYSVAPIIASIISIRSHGGSISSFFNS